MKIDMHCHVKEGSVDSRVSLEEYIQILKEKGFQGMVVTDHNTYNGYRQWKYVLKEKYQDDFVVLKGIEYDTKGCRTYPCDYAGRCKDAPAGASRTSGGGAD